MKTNKTTFVCLTALLSAGSGCSALTNFDGLTGGDTGGEVLPDAYVPPGVDASIDAFRGADAGTDAYVLPDMDAPPPDAWAPDAWAPDGWEPDALEPDAFRGPPDAWAPDAFTPCTPLFRNPATVPARVTGLSLVQTVSGVSGPNAIAPDVGHAANVTGIALTSGELVATHWNGFFMRYSRNATTGRVTYVGEQYIGDNTTSVLTSRTGHFLTSAAYRYAASVPLVRDYPTSGGTFSGGALTTPGSDFGPTPYNVWGLIEAPSGMLYAAALGRVENRGASRGSHILRIDPTFPSLPDGVDPTDVGGVGGPGVFSNLRALEASQAYVYWVTGVDVNTGPDAYPAYPHRVTRAPYIACGNSLGTPENFDASATPAIVALAAHPDGRLFAGSTAGLTIIPPSFTGPSTTSPLPVRHIVDMQFTPDGSRLIITGTVGTFEAGDESARIVVLDTSSVTPTVLRTYGPGQPDGTFPDLFRPGQIRLYDGFVYIGSHFASGAAGTPNMHVFSWATTPRSCAEVLALQPSAADGNYTIDPDGDGPLASASVYCDMARGGWTLIMATNGLGPSAQTESTSVPLHSGRYLPLAFVRALAAQGTQVHISTAGRFYSQGITSVANALPIQNLRMGQHTSASISIRSAADIAPFWTGARATVDYLGNNCTEAHAYPEVHQTCGNGTGLHIIADISGWTGRTPAADIEVYVR